MLREKSALELVRAGKSSRLWVERAGQELGEGRLAIPVGAEQRDAVVVIDPKREVAEYGPFRLIADGHVFHADDRWGGALLRVGEADGHHAVLRHGGDRLELG